MRLAALYDIHGNLPALEAVLDEIRAEGTEELLVGGDVFPGPMGREALELLLDQPHPVRFISGNGDRAVLEQFTASRTTAVPEQARPLVEWAAAQIERRHADLITGWPASLQMTIDGVGEVLFCHATPRSDTEIFTRLTPDERLLPLLAGADAPLVVCGHTHMQFDRRLGNVRIVNAGSVGMPFGEPGAYWLRLGPDVQLRRTTYDFARAVERISATAYPQARHFGENHILRPPSETQMLETFERRG